MSIDFYDYEPVAVKAKHLIEDVRIVTGEDMSIDTAVQCVMLEQIAPAMDDRLKEIAAEIYQNCT